MPFPNSLVADLRSSPQCAWLRGGSEKAIGLYARPDTIQGWDPQGSTGILEVLRPLAVGDSLGKLAGDASHGCGKGDAAGAALWEASITPLPTTSSQRNDSTCDRL